MTELSTDREYFEKLYEATVDPFRIWRSEYEQSKRAHALGLLQKDHYGSIFEPGCGNGAFSLELAGFCDHLTSVDWSEDALRAAALHCAGIPNVEFYELDFPRSLPNQRFDLLVASELLYYFADDRLNVFFESLPEIVKPGGEILLVHWRGKSDDYPMNGDLVHEAFHRQKSVQILETFEHPQYLVSAGILK